MDQHTILLQTLIDSIKNLTNEVSSLKNKVEALEEENKNLKQQLYLNTFVPLEDCRDEYPEDPKLFKLLKKKKKKKNKNKNKKLKKTL